MSLIKYRIKIEIEYLIALSNEKEIKSLKPFTKKEIDNLRKIYLQFDLSEAKKIKKLKKKQTMMLKQLNIIYTQE